jgi:hypothetical protein
MDSARRATVLDMADKPAAAKMQSFKKAPTPMITGGRLRQKVRHHIFKFLPGSSLVREDERSLRTALMHIISGPIIKKNDALSQIPCLDLTAVWFPQDEDGTVVHEPRANREELNDRGLHSVRRVDDALQSCRTKPPRGQQLRYCPSFSY